MHNMRSRLENKLMTGRRKGAQSVSHHYPTIVSNHVTSVRSNHQRKTSIIPEASMLDNRGRFIENGNSTAQNSNKMINQDAS